MDHSFVVQNFKKLVYYISEVLKEAIIEQDTLV